MIQAQATSIKQALPGQQRHAASEVQDAQGFWLDVPLFVFFTLHTNLTVVQVNCQNQPDCGTITTIGNKLGSTSETTRNVQPTHQEGRISNHTHNKFSPAYNTNNSTLHHPRPLTHLHCLQAMTCIQMGCYLAVLHCMVPYFGQFSGLRQRIFKPGFRISI